MGRSKQTIHGCTMLISGLRRRIIAVFAPRTMLRWSIGHNYLVDPVVSNWRAHEARQNSLSQLTQPAYSVRGMSCLNPLGYVRSKFPAEILISLASVHLLWKFSSPSVASHWSAILNSAKLNPRSHSAKMTADKRRCPKEFQLTFRQYCLLEVTKIVSFSLVPWRRQHCRNVG